MWKIMILVLVIVGVAFAISNPVSDYRSVESTLSDSLIRKVASRLGSDYEISLEGVGGGIKKEGIWLITAMFGRYEKPQNLDSARELIVSCVQEFLREVNTDETIRPYLRDYPFSAKNLYISIINYDAHKDVFKHPHIGFITAKDNTVIYKTDDPEHENRYKWQMEETYDEALSKLRENASLKSL